MSHSSSMQSFTTSAVDAKKLVPSSTKPGDILTNLLYFTSARMRWREWVVSFYFGRTESELSEGSVREGLKHRTVWHPEKSGGEMLKSLYCLFY